MFHVMEFRSTGCKKKCLFCSNQTLKNLISNVSEDEEEKMETETDDASAPEDEEKRLADLSHQVELQVLEEVENLEERIASASLQVKA